MLPTYKHDWIACADCGTLTRSLKRRYLASVLLPERAARAILPGKVVNQFYPMQAVREGADAFYSYYQDTAASSPERTKYRTETADLLAELKAVGIDLAGKSVLDVSGGPGFLARDLGAIASKVVVTEYSPEAVAGMIRHLGVTAVTFDYNSQDLGDAVGGPYDIVLARYSINFCLDLPRFARALRRVLVPGGRAYISFVAPTLGFLLRWQHDEYTVNRLYTSETMARSFVQEGFTLETRYRHPGYGFMENRGLAKNAMFLPFAALSWLRNARVSAPLSRALRHHNHLHIYRNPA
jgi:SAM-dependent methyltransferase